MSHKTCSHAKYRMTCDQFEALRARAGGRCEICEQLAHYAGGLAIDHDSTLGFWAVRGLLCTSCNCRLGTFDFTGPEADHYLANPWHQVLGYDLSGIVAGPVEGPALDPAVAAELLAQAAADAENARHRQLKDWRIYRTQVHELMRAAHRGGMRQVDIAKAANSSREVVRTATLERNLAAPPKKN